MVVGVPLIVGDVAEQMVVVELAHDKLIRLVLIVYVGKDTEQVAFLDVDVVELLLVGIVEPLAAGKLHEQVEGFYLVGIALGVAHLGERLLMDEILVQGLVDTSDALCRQQRGGEEVAVLGTAGGRETDAILLE